MHGFLVALLFAADGIAAGAPPEARCPTAAQLDAELQRLGERATLNGLGDSEVTITGTSMRVVLRDRMGSALGVREVVAPAGCAERVSLAAVLLVAWAKTWNETALAPAPMPAAPSARREIEVGISVGGTLDGDAAAPTGGVFAVVQIARALGAALTADFAGRRQVPLGPGAATYAGSRIGGGLAVRLGSGVVWTEAALLPQLTRLAFEGKALTTNRVVTVWGASLEVRARLGLRWGRLAPFVGLALDRALVGERLTLDDTDDSRRLSPWDLRAVAGASWNFGGPG